MALSSPEAMVEFLQALLHFHLKHPHFLFGLPSIAQKGRILCTRGQSSNKNGGKLVDKHSSFHKLSGTILSMLCDTGVVHDFFKAPSRTSPVTHSGNSLIKVPFINRPSFHSLLSPLPHLSFLVLYLKLTNST